MEKFIQKTELTKEQLIEKYRYILVEDVDYLEFIIQDKKTELFQKGFYDINIKYNGFYSQGDGASITANIRLINAIELLNIPMQYKKYTDEVMFSIKRNDSRYYHENTLCIDYDLYLNKLSLKAENCIHGYIQDIEKCLLDYIKSESKKIYNQLESEYEFLTSDDVIFEYIQDNMEILNIEEIN